MIINSVQEALLYFISHCLKGQSKTIETLNGAKGPVAYRVQNLRTDILKKVDTYCVFFKREYLHSFEYLYKNMKGWGEGQTLNLKMLRYAAQQGDWIAVVMPDERVEVMRAVHWLMFVSEHDTKRIPSGEIGEEASVPAKLLVSWDDHIRPPPPVGSDITKYF